MVILDLVPEWVYLPTLQPNDCAAMGAAVAIVVLAWPTVGRGFALLCAALALVAFAIIGSAAIPVAMATVLLGVAVLDRTTGNRGVYRRSAGTFARQCVIILAGLTVYTTLRLIEASEGVAFANANQLISFERSLGLYFEPDLQSWVLRSETLTRVLNWTYSFMFLALTTGALLWLWFVDARNYRLLRNTLGVSAALAILTLVAFPVAPPRLVAGSGMLDTIVMLGREHSYANEYAAVPSLHVGWMVAVGYVFAASIGGRRGVLIGLIPGVLMTVTVIATGNHMWIDGAIGAAYALGAAALVSGDARHAPQRALGFARGVGTAAALGASHAATAIMENGRVRFTLLTLGGLLTYLIMGQILQPGFTDFWGYLTGQVAVIMLLLVLGEVFFAREGGISWLTHGVAVACCYADVLGTDGNLYAAIDEYDKLTHFAGVAAVTAFVYEALRALNIRRGWSWSANSRLLIAVAVGFAVGIGWEVYELLGDKVFHTARVYGPWDTSYDIASDAMGALAVALLLLLGEQRVERGAEEPRSSAGLQRSVAAGPADGQEARRGQDASEASR